MFHEWNPYIHFFFEFAAYAIGFRFYQRLRRNNPDQLTNRMRILMLLVSSVGAFGLARVGGVIESHVLFQSVGAVCGTGKTVIGALVGGLIAVELVKFMIGLRTRTGDLYTLPLILGMIIGRIGCFLAGQWDCTYGDPALPSLSWLAVDFGDGVPRLAMQLLEIGFLGLLGLSLYHFRPILRRQVGMQFGLFFLSYCLFRLIADNYKPLARDIVVGLSVTQWFALIGLVFYTLTWLPALIQDLGRVFRTREQIRGIKS